MPGEEQLVMNKTHNAAHAAGPLPKNVVSHQDSEGTGHSYVVGISRILAVKLQASLHHCRPSEMLQDANASCFAHGGRCLRVVAQEFEFFAQSLRIVCGHYKS